MEDTPEGIQKQNKIMRKIEITWTTVAGTGTPYHGIAKVYTGSGYDIYEGEINIRQDDNAFVTLPGSDQDFQLDTIFEPDRSIMASMAQDYYNGTNTSGVTWRTHPYKPEKSKKLVLCNICNSSHYCKKEKNNK